MINVDITSLLKTVGSANGSISPSIIKPVIPEGSGDNEGWVNAISLCLVIAALGFGVYAVTCDDGKQAQLRVNSRGAVISKKEPMGPKINSNTGEDVRD